MTGEIFTRFFDCVSGNFKSGSLCTLREQHQVAVFYGVRAVFVFFYFKF